MVKMHNPSLLSVYTAPIPLRTRRVRRILLPVEFSQPVLGGLEVLHNLSKNSEGPVDTSQYTRRVDHQPLVTSKSG